MAKAVTLGLVLGAQLAPGFGSVFKTAREQAQGLKSTLMNAKLGATAATDMARLGERLERLRAEQARLGTGNVKLANDITSTQKALNRASDTAARYGVTMDNATKKQRQFGAAADQAARSLARLRATEQRQAVRNEAKGQLLGTIGAIGTVVMPVRQAIQFESAMADVKKVVDFETPQQFKQMGNDLLLLGTRIPMPAEGLAKIMASAGQSGIAKNELLSFTETAAKMGIAFDISAENAGEMMANWRAGLGLSQPRVVALADSVNYLSNNMNAKASAIGEVIQRQGAVAMAAGLSEQKVAALGAAFLSSGATPEIAATGLKNFTNALTKGDAATKAQKLAFDELGLSARKVSLNMQRDSEGTILTVLERLSKAPKHKQSALVSQLFGEESKGAIVPLLANLDNLRNAFGLVGDETKYAGSMENEFKERSNTTANSLQLLGNTASRAAINLGTIFLPAINTAAGALGKKINSLTELSERYPTLTKAVALAAVGFIGLSTAALVAKYAGTFLAGGISTVVGAFDLVRSTVIRANVALLATRNASLAAAVGVRGFNLALLANPIGIVVAAVVAGAVAIYQHWGPIKSFFTGLWDGMSEGLAPLTSMLSSLGQVLEPIWQKAQQLWDVVAKFFTTADHEPSEVAESWGKKIGKVVGGTLVSMVPGASMATALLGPSNEKKPTAPLGQTAAAHGVSPVQPVQPGQAPLAIPVPAAPVPAQTVAQTPRKTPPSLDAQAAEKARALLDDPKWQSPRHQAILQKAIARGEAQTPAAPGQPATPQPAATPGQTVAAHGVTPAQPVQPRQAPPAVPAPAVPAPAQTVAQTPHRTPSPMDAQAAEKARALLDDPKWQSPRHQAILQKAIARGEARTPGTLGQSATPQPAAAPPATLDVRPAAPQPQQPPSPGAAASPAPAQQPKGGGQGGGVTVNNNVTVTGVGLEHVQQLVKTALDAFSRDLESKLSAMRAQQMRLSYGG